MLGYGRGRQLAISRRRCGMGCRPARVAARFRNTARNTARNPVRNPVCNAARLSSIIAARFHNAVPSQRTLAPRWPPSTSLIPGDSQDFGLMCRNNSPPGSTAGLTAGSVTNPPTQNRPHCPHPSLCFHHKSQCAAPTNTVVTHKFPSPHPMIPCTKCNRRFRNGSGLKRHLNTIHGYHPGLDIPVVEFQREHHPFLTGPCGYSGILVQR